MTRFEKAEALGLINVSDTAILKLYFDTHHASPELRRSYEYTFLNAPEKVQNATRCDMCESIIKAVTANETDNKRQYELVYNAMKAVANRYNWYIALCIFVAGPPKKNRHE